MNTGISFNRLIVTLLVFIFSTLISRAEEEKINTLPTWVALTDLRALRATYSNVDEKHDIMTERFENRTDDVPIVVTHALERVYFYEDEYDDEKEIYEFKIFTDGRSQTSTIHKIYVYQDSQKIDVTNDYSKRDNGWFQLPMVRHGDEVEIVYSVSGYHQGYDNYKGELGYVDDQFTSFNSYVSHTVLVPDDVTLIFDQLADERQYLFSIKDDIKKYHLPFPIPSFKRDEGGWSFGEGAAFNEIPNMEMLRSVTKQIDQYDDKVLKDIVKNYIHWSGYYNGFGIDKGMANIYATINFVSKVIVNGEDGVTGSKIDVSREEAGWLLTNIFKTRSENAWPALVNDEFYVFLRTNYGDLWINPLMEASKQMEGWFNIPKFNEEDIEWVTEAKPNQIFNKPFRSEIHSTLYLDFPDGLDKAGTYKLDQKIYGYLKFGMSFDTEYVNDIMKMVTSYFVPNYEKAMNDNYKFSWDYDDGSVRLEAIFKVPDAEKRYFIHGQRRMPIFLGNIYRMFEHRFQRHLIMTDYPNLSPARMVENIIINDGGRFDFALGEEEIIGDYHKYKLKKFVEDGKTHIQNTYDIYYFNDRIPEKASIKYLEELEIIQEALFAPFEEFNKNAPVYLSEGVYGLSSLYSMQPLPPPSTRSINNQSEEFKNVLYRKEATIFELLQRIIDIEDAPLIAKVKARLAYGYALLEQRKFMEALEHYEFALENTVHVAAITDIHLGTIYQSIGNTKEAENSFQSALDKTPPSKRHGLLMEYLEYLRFAYIQDDITQKDVDDVVENISRFDDLSEEDIAATMELLISMNWKVDNFDQAANLMHNWMHKMNRDVSIEWSNLYYIQKLAGNDKKARQVKIDLEAAGHHLILDRDKEGKRRPIYRAKPYYPSNTRVKGWGDFEVDILPSGRVDNCQIIAGENVEWFEEDLCFAALQTRFMPFNKHRDDAMSEKYVLHYEFNTFETAE